MDFNLPKVASFLFCHNIQQDVLTKNYELRGVFQGFGPPAYPFGAGFVTFSRFYFEGEGEFQIDISLFNAGGEKVSDSAPRRLSFTAGSAHDLITAWQVAFPAAGVYTFKVFCNNLNIGEYRITCH